MQSTVSVLSCVWLHLMTLTFDRLTMHTHTDRFNSHFQVNVGKLVASLVRCQAG